MKKSFRAIFIQIMCAFFTLGGLAYAEGLDADEFMLEEITVTAQKREENQQKVAIAMDVLTGEDLSETGKNDIEQILGTVSSALVNKSSDGLRVSIRGVSNDNAPNMGLQSSTPTVAINSDGVYTNRDTGGQGLFDIERVEVLYGPQSTLYSSNSPGGIINIVTGSPKLDKYEGSGSVEVGNYSLLHTEGMVNAPISDKVAVRAAFSTTVRDGYLSNGADDEDSKSARLKALYAPTDKFSIVVTGQHSSSRTIGFAGVEEFADQDDRDNPWTASSSGASSDVPNLSEQDKIHGKIDWDLDFASLSIIPSYSERESTSSSSMDYGGTTVTQDSVASGYEKGTEARLSSNADSFLTWIVGFNWYESKDQMSNISSDGGWDDSYNMQESTVVYGNVIYPLTDTLRLSAGLRYSWDKNTSKTERYPNQEDPSDPNPQLEISTMEYDSPDYKIGFEYDLSEASMLYSDWSSSYRTQGMSTDADGNPFPPEELNAYTIGVKNRFFDNRLQLNLSAYYYDYKNYYAVNRVSTLDQKDLDGDGDYDGENLIDPETGAERNETVVVSDDNAKGVGDANIIGVDVQTTVVITPKDIFNLSVSYLKSEFDDMFFDYYDITNEIGIPDEDYSGAEMTFSPNWTISASYSHSFTLWNGADLKASIDSRYQSEYLLTWNDKTMRLSDDYTPEITDITDIRIQEAYHISNFSIVYYPPESKWSLSAYIKNIEDYAVKTSWMSETLIIGSPRTYGAVLSIKF